MALTPWRYRLERFKDFIGAWIDRCIRTCQASTVLPRQQPHFRFPAFSPHIVTLHTYLSTLLISDILRSSVMLRIEGPASLRDGENDENYFDDRQTKRD